MLSASERDRCALYLEQDASANEALVSELERRSGASHAMTNLLRQESLCARIIAKKLRSIEDAAIG